MSDLFDDEAVGGFAFFHAERNVMQRFFLEALEDFPRLHELALSARKVGGVDHEFHRYGGLINDKTLQGLGAIGGADRSEEHPSELPSLMRISYAVFCLKKKRY